VNISNSEQTRTDSFGDRQVAIWLLTCCALVFAMVILGGVTRLTGSGLSMVDWRPIMGVVPPMGDAAWQETFDLYRSSPEFQHRNFDMGVEDFKGIFWLEYLHRLLGRLIGIFFLVPFVFFAWTGRIAKTQTPKYIVMFVLGGLQGLLGWYMVKSGLVDDPHVSQYRLTAHLVAAFAIYAYMFWVALGLLSQRATPARHPYYKPTLALTTLIVITVISGGFVAGLKAGLLYNTFPTMGGQWIPQGMLALEPVWRNFFDHPVTAQFDHRLLAITTLLLVALYWMGARRRQLPPGAMTATNILLAIVLLQVALGISTLLLRVPVVLASAHQATAMALFTVALYLCHVLRGVGQPRHESQR
jgi:cytochrome c oxidase assembly protein subunit 15